MSSLLLFIGTTLMGMGSYDAIYKNLQNYNYIVYIITILCHIVSHSQTIFFFYIQTG